MNTSNDFRWLLFATVPVHGYVNLATPISRGMVWLWRRAAGAVQRRLIAYGKGRAAQGQSGGPAWASGGGAAAPSAGAVQVAEGAGHPRPR